MRIRELSAYVVRLPFRNSFSHASATRSESENVFVECKLTNGTTGWGEGVPRSYVTGETPEGCLAQLADTPLAEQMAADCSSWSGVIALCDRFDPPADREDPRGCYGNALRCAVELSILDAFGHLFNKPVSSVARHVAWAQPILSRHDVVQYSAVIGSGESGLWRKALARRLYGFRQCKVKVGAADEDDVARLRTIRRWFGPDMDLRLDANGAWCAANLPAKIEPLKPFGITAIEQPLPHEEVESLGELRTQIGVPVMLDESLTSVKDAQVAIAGRTCDLFNIRLSKCGGFLASLRLAAVAHSAGLGYQLGCHPGESGVLSAAGRHWASSVANIRYLEGSYDRHLFYDLLTNEDMTFGFGGRARAIARPGLGITINKDVLQKAMLSRQVFEVGG